MPTSLLLPGGNRKGSCRSDLHATASSALAVPTDWMGGIYKTSVAALLSNSCLKECEQWNVHGFTLKATDGSEHTITFYAVKSDGSTYDVELYTLTIPDDAAPGDYIPIGGPDGEFFAVHSTLYPGVLKGGFAFKTDSNSLLGSIWWNPIGAF